MCKMESTTTDVNHDRHILKQPTKVLLTLSNVLLPKEKLTSTPSMTDGLDFETEVNLRIVGCEWIQTAGILLKLPQVSRVSVHIQVLICLRVRNEVVWQAEVKFYFYQIYLFVLLLRLIVLNAGINRT